MTTSQRISSSNSSSHSCPTCCHNGRAQPALAQPDSSNNPFSLQNLIQAGTISLEIPRNVEQVICSHPVAEDGWHTTTDLFDLRAFLSLNDQHLLEPLVFLVKHEFIHITFATNSSVLVMRVYLVPFDLPNVRGRLRTRDAITVMNPGKKYLLSVLPLIEIDISLWITGRSGTGQPAERLFPSQDARSLTQLYSDLTLPYHEENLDHLKISGLRSKLYGYQRASVSAMLRMEANAKPTPDPLFIKLQGVKGDLFYYQPGSCEILREAPHATQSKGGMLCEELGTGKTVMILALILATLNVLPELPESYHETYEVFTPLSYSHFPWKTTTPPATQRSSSLVEHTNRPRLPSLVDLCMHKLRTHDCGITATHEELLEQRHLFLPMAHNAPFYLVSEIPPSLYSEYSNRRQPEQKYKMMYLSTATLIVVPENLITQWSNEIMKHCRRPLRVLTVFAKTKMPGPNKLASDYDVVLTAYSRISIESSLRDTSKLYTGFNCSCPTFRNIRVPECSCKTPPGVSTLLQVHWKRIVRDEGHNSATNATNINNFLNSLSAERRWIVTGTPTTNLLGLNFGKSAEDVTDECVLEYPDDDEDDDVAQFHRETASAWGTREREDLRKLGDMMARFLMIPRFANDGDAFKDLVIEPLMRGPALGSVKVLEQVMQSVMIRHRIEEIEKDIVLPPLQEHTVLLDLHHYGVMSFNLHQAMVAVNAVDSERKDVDYLFHPTNQAPLQEAIENISLSLFWRGDGEEFDNDLPGALRRAKGARIHAFERDQPESDVKLVDEAITHIEHALNDKMFRTLQHGLEVPYYVSNLPPLLLREWANFVSPDSSIAFIFPLRACKLREAVLRQPKITGNSLVVYAQAVHEDELARAAYLEAREMAKKTNGKKRLKGVESGFYGKKVKKMVTEVRRAVDTPARVRELAEELNKTQLKLRALAGYDLDNEERRTGNVESGHASSSANPTGLRRDFLQMSPIAQVRIGNSTSTKLNYILNEVSRYASTEKFLIFSRQPFALAHIVEGLELLGIRFLLFTSEVTGVQRRQYVTTFETSDLYRVFLMELKHGARGLNIVSASRVIFCEPVWQADVESQAIKRVHRIGQTRPVTVKTLAIRGTFEEAMIRRRNALKGHSGKLPGMTDEGGIRSFLQNPTFLEPSPPSDLSLDISLLFPPGLQETHKVQDHHPRALYGSSRGSTTSGPAMEVDILIPHAPEKPGTRFGVEEGKANHTINNGEKSRGSVFAVSRDRASITGGRKRPKVTFAL